jgi:hypothetical protein
MNIERINNLVKLSIWILIVSIVLIIAIYLNIGRDFQKQVVSGHLESISGEGLGILGFLLYYYLFYLIVFIIWLAILNYKKSGISYNSIRNQLWIIFIFSILPTIFILLFLLLSSNSPFKQYPHIKKLAHEIENGKIIKYSIDSVKIYEANIVNDKIVGKEITRYNTGIISSEKNYIENILDGESIEYYENGNKKSSIFYVMGSSKQLINWFENGQKSYLYNEDSLYSKYEWWENGQIKSNDYRGSTSNYWEKDGKQTLYNGNGKITIWADSTGSKQLEITYKNGNVIKEISWYSKGTINRQRDFIILDEKEAENIGCKNGEFRGYRDIYYYENGKSKSINYRGNTSNNESFYKSIKYDENGNTITD